MSEEAIEAFQLYVRDHVIPAAQRFAVALQDWIEAGIEAVEEHANGENA